MPFTKHEYRSEPDVTEVPGYIRISQEVWHSEQSLCEKIELDQCVAWQVSSSGYVYWYLRNLSSKTQRVFFTSEVANRLISWRAPSGNQTYGPRSLDLLPNVQPLPLSLSFEVRDWGLEQIQTKVIKASGRNPRPVLLVSNVHLLNPQTDNHPRSAPTPDQMKTDTNPNGQELTILHISDIHLQNDGQVQPYKSQLLADLRKELGVKRLDYLVISGDVADKAKSDEYAAARELIAGILEDFHMEKIRVIMVPGNHDVDWQKSMDAYTRVIPKARLDPRTLVEGTYIMASDGSAIVYDEAVYQERFSAFSTEFFTHFGRQVPYPLAPEKQGIVRVFPEDRIVFLELNSACRTDHHHKAQSGINGTAVANAVAELMKLSLDESWIGIMVWHHPTDDVGGGMSKGFLDQFSLQNFQIGLHGHIHRAQEGDFKYDDRRGIHIIGAGTFGAPSDQQVPGIPLQYHLLKVDRASRAVTVHTRKKETPDGTWKADARWGSSNNPRPYFKISLDRSASA